MSGMQLTDGTNPELQARARAYRALSDAYSADPAQPLYIDQVRRDLESAHRWLAQQGQQPRSSR